MGAYPYPHWANEEDRLKPGNLPFLEIPLTTDSSHRFKPLGTRLPYGIPYELRIEFGSFRDWHLPIINKALENMAGDNVGFRCLCIFTHNNFEYSDADAPQTKTLHYSVTYLDELRREYGIIPATLASVRSQFVQAFGASP